MKGGICHAIHQFVEANNKYMKDEDSNIRYCLEFDVQYSKELNCIMIYPFYLKKKKNLRIIIA